jgi:hypothetical protein
MWATAFFAGLRRGELMALPIEDGFEAGRVAARVRVERGYDPKAREYMTPKSRAGTRTVPIMAELRGYLAKQKLRLGRAEELLFGAGTDRPFDPGVVASRAGVAR